MYITLHLRLDRPPMHLMRDGIQRALTHRPAEGLWPWLPSMPEQRRRSMWRSDGSARKHYAASCMHRRSSYIQHNRHAGYPLLYVQFRLPSQPPDPQPHQPRPLQMWAPMVPPRSARQESRLVQPHVHYSAFAMRADGAASKKQNSGSAGKRPPAHRRLLPCPT